MEDGEAIATPFISIVVPTRNRSAMLARLLDSFTGLTYPAWEAIVVDDGSTDDTRVVVERFRTNGLPISYLWQPWGKMGAARNLGIDHARGEIVAFTDDDCVVEPRWLDALAAGFADHPEALGVQGKTVTDHAHMTPFTRQIEQLEGGAPHRTCNIAYRREILRRLGGFDPQLIRGEDVVMGMRVLEHGPIVFAPDAVVEHPPRSKEWANRHAWRVLLESELHFKRTYPRYAAARSQTLSLQKAEHVVSRWLLLPLRRYWRWHYAYLRRNPGDYLRHVPLIVREKLALFSLLPFFLRQWWSTHPHLVQYPHAWERGASARHVGENLPSPAGGRGAGGEGAFVSIVVPTHNRAHLLPGLLAALAAQDYFAYEVMVVDDASDDATPRVLAAWEGDGRRWLRLEASRGSYAARNRGWRAARGEILAFTDDDCLPDPEWLTALLRALPGAAGAQGVTLAQPGQITPFTHQIEQRSPGPPYRTCNIAYPRATLERLGGFDERLRWYADNILGLRARQLGPIAFAADAVVQHPPRPREWRSRQTWLLRFQADVTHRQELRRLGVEPVQVPGSALPVVLWILRPMLKQTLTHVRYLLCHPADYLRQAPPMVREKWEMLLALREFWHPHPPAPLSRPRERGELGTLSPLEGEGLGKGPEIAVGATSRGYPIRPRGVREVVSVVVVTRDRPELLAGALDAIARQTWAHREVIVVDNGCCEQTRTVAQEREARYVSVPDVTLAAARQAGIEEARGELVAFTDDDCLPDPGWLDAIVSAFRRQPDLAGVQGRTEAEAGPLGAYAVRVPGPDRLYRTCNIAYRREVLQRAGGFDLDFQGWFEDTALAARVLEYGPIGFEPRAVVTHRAMPRRPRDRERWRMLLEDERRLAERHSAFYRRTRGRWFHSTVIARWLIGSPLKTLLRELPSGRDHPRAYLDLIKLLLRERTALLAALVLMPNAEGSQQPPHRSTRG